MAVTIRGLYLAERVEVDQDTKNLTLIGCFRALLVAGLPHAARPFEVVAYLTNAVGHIPVRIEVLRLDTMDAIYSVNLSMWFPDRLREHRLRATISNCVFPSPGNYEVDLWAGGELVAATPFTVQELEEE